MCCLHEELSSHWLDFRRIRDHFLNKINSLKIFRFVKDLLLIFNKNKFCMCNFNSESWGWPTRGTKWPLSACKPIPVSKLISAPTPGNALNPSLILAAVKIASRWYFLFFAQGVIFGAPFISRTNRSRAHKMPRRMNHTGREKCERAPRVQKAKLGEMDLAHHQRIFGGIGAYKNQQGASLLSDACTRAVFALANCVSPSKQRVKKNQRLINSQFARFYYISKKKTLFVSVPRLERIFLDEMITKTVCTERGLN